MDETVAEFIKRTTLKIPMNELTTILKAWDFLSENQLKESVVQHLVQLCEEKRAGLNDATLTSWYCRCTPFSTAHLHTQKENELF
uniref:Uncharacterized protein n=1 Tax=Cebus imitator TaxID=2715852 RepID=A0A2K5Q1R7_CEBIM